MNATRTTRHGMFFAAVTGLLIALTAAPVLAGHESPIRHDDAARHNDAVRHQAPRRGPNEITACTVPHPGPRIGFAKRQFDRGRALGVREGTDRGCRDASRCIPFCDAIPRRLERFSKSFVAGYVNAYAPAYESAFRQYRPASPRARWRATKAPRKWARGSARPRGGARPSGGIRGRTGGPGRSR